MAPLLFTLYYSLWKISRNLDFLHRGPPTLNVGQQIYCFFTIYYLLFRTESEILFASQAADPEERPEWPPLLFTLYYSLWKISRAPRATNPECRKFLHLGPPTRNIRQTPRGFFCILGQRPETSARPAEFIASLATNPKHPPDPLSFFASRATNPKHPPATLSFFCISGHLSMHLGQHFLHVGQLFCMSAQRIP